VDLYFSETGDLKLSPNRDLAITDSDWRDTAQQAYIIMQTMPGDFLLYPRLGSKISELYGMPQSRETGNLGIRIIEEALTNNQNLAASKIAVEAVPTGPQSIRFDIYIVNGPKKSMILSIDQPLGMV